MTAPIVWLTGLPASGKSTLAVRVRERLAALKRPAFVLDSDAIRDALGTHSYDRAHRDDFYRTLANLAALVARQDIIALVAATAPRRAHRDAARTFDGRVIEVFVDVPVAECEARDPKGLYAAARRDLSTALPGIGVPYEPPEAPDVVARGGLDDDAAARIAALAAGV